MLDDIALTLPTVEIYTIQLHGLDNAAALSNDLS